MPIRRGIPLSDDRGGAARFTTTSWDAEGVATLEAAGSDVRSALEAGLRAALALIVGARSTPAGASRSAPIRGEGEDLVDLFTDMVEDLMDQIDYFGVGLHDIVVDGVLRRDGGGYVAWGYAAESDTPSARVALPLLLDATSVEMTSEGTVIRASFGRA